MSKVKRNFIYSVAYQMLLIIAPLVTVPYTSRVLGVDGIGTYAFTYAIVVYFTKIAMLGVNNHGSRSIAKNRHDKKALSRTFWSIYTIQAFMTILMIITYVAFTLLFMSKYQMLMLINGIYLVSTLLEANWFFYGLENVRIAVIRNSIVKIAAIALIFTFVKTPDDLLAYAAILSVSTVIGQITLLPSVLRKVNFVKIDFQSIKPHIKSCLMLFIPIIAVSIYRIMDKIMLGAMSSTVEVGYYEQADKIITIPLGIITALGSIMIPRVSNLLSAGHHTKVMTNLHKMMDFSMFLALPMCLGLIAISHDFILVFLGDAFMKSSTLALLLAVTVVFNSFANAIRSSYLIPKERDKTFTASVILGAVVNLAFNFALIPLLQSVGAAIATIAAEFSVMFYQTMAVRHELPIRSYLKSATPFLAKAFIMFLVVYSLRIFNFPPLLSVLLQVSTGVTVYALLNWTYIDRLLDLRSRFKLR